MRVTKPYRGARSVKRLDMSPMLEALKDQRQWAALGLVAQPADGSPHWSIHGESEDILVEVELQPTRELVTARLAAGMWIVPDVGEEVAVVLPAGELAFMPVLVCILASSVPCDQGPAPKRVVIARGPGTQVLIHDGAGGAVSLSLKSDSVGVDNKYAGHIHLDSTGSPTSGPLKTVIPNLPNPSFPVPDSVHPFLDEDGNPALAPYHAGEGLDDAGIVGTDVLLAK